jgi:hypothetical protein
LSALGAWALMIVRCDAWPSLSTSRQRESPLLQY